MEKRERSSEHAKVNVNVNANANESEDVPKTFENKTANEQEQGKGKGKEPMDVNREENVRLVETQQHSGYHRTVVHADEGRSSANNGGSLRRVVIQSVDELSREREYDTEVGGKKGKETKEEEEKEKEKQQQHEQGMDKKESKKNIEIVRSPRTHGNEITSKSTRGFASDRNKSGVEEERLQGKEDTLISKSRYDNLRVVADVDMTKEETSEHDIGSSNVADGSGGGSSSSSSSSGGNTNFTNVNKLSITTGRKRRVFSAFKDEGGAADNNTNHNSFDKNVSVSSAALFVEGFKRPLNTTKLLHRFGEFGPVKRFWINNVKTHCYIVFESVDDAVKCRTAMDGTYYPTDQPKIHAGELRMKHVTSEEASRKIDEEEMKKRNGQPSFVHVAAPPPPQTTTLSSRKHNDLFTKNIAHDNHGHSNNHAHLNLNLNPNPNSNSNPNLNPYLATNLADVTGFQSRAMRSLQQSNDIMTRAKEPTEFFNWTKTQPKIFWCALTDEQADKRDAELAEQEKEEALKKSRILSEEKERHRRDKSKSSSRDIDNNKDKRFDRRGRDKDHHRDRNRSSSRKFESRHPFKQIQKYQSFEITNKITIIIIITDLVPRGHDYRREGTRYRERERDKGREKDREKEKERDRERERTRRSEEKKVHQSRSRSYRSGRSKTKPYKKIKNIESEAQAVNKAKRVLQLLTI
ncbi:hypothetical protein RFI_34594 [Reticulomyxa filosa]|uniref:RRM domain-containing protein n=1 Tax=Reticulomyxa filosa TaxID=46433 RepID=X6LLK7_RETFI|nr:hypothetical protein RFI_34594 [Reticulomyxa filosa]|eukprot:ETO02818.1 hypothetical protein RFI_34594 [Reticulomyxa filosa]